MVLAVMIAFFVALSVPATANAQQGMGCVDCSLCMKDGETGNKAFEGDDESVHELGGGIHENCIASGPCSEQHPVTGECWGSGGGSDSDQLVLLLQAVGTALAHGDLSEAQVLTQSALNSRVEYSSARNAIQVVGCGGTVIAHVPLTIGSDLEGAAGAFSVLAALIAEERGLGGSEG